MAFLRGVFGERRSMRYKLMLAFALMSIIPLLILAYLVTSFIFPEAAAPVFQVTLIVLFALWVSWTGFMLAKEIILPVVDLAIETKLVADGNYDSRISVRHEDEVGDVAVAVNAMSDKIRGYIGELQEYSKKTRTLNASIHRKVLTLTNLMRLGDLISSGTPYDEIVSFACEKMSAEAYEGFCVVFTKGDEGTYRLKALSNSSNRQISIEKLGEELGDAEKFFRRNEYLVFDSKSPRKPWQKEFQDKFVGMNAIIFPMKTGENVFGAIVVGNYIKGTELVDEDVDVVRAFNKELILAFQSAQIFERVKSLEVIDTLTGLYTFTYLADRFEDEINRSVYYQRPCSLILLSVDDFDMYADRYGTTRSEEIIKQLAKMLMRETPSIGKVARGIGSEFGIILPEMNKRDSLKMAEEIRKKIEDMELLSGECGKITASVGVGENPIDGANAKGIIARARQYMETARSGGKNRVVGE